MSYTQLTKEQVAELNKALSPIFLAKEQEAFLTALDKTLEMVSTRVGALDPTLVGLATIPTGADRLPYATGTDQFSSTVLTAFARGLLAATTAEQARATLGIPTLPTNTDNLPEGSVNRYYTDLRVQMVGQSLNWISNPMIAEGDIIYGGTGGIPVRLPKGTNGQIIRQVNGVPAWGNETQGSATVWGGISGTLSNQTDLQSALTAALARSNHTGTQAASTISDFSEAVDDRVASMLVPGTNMSITYDDTLGLLTLNAEGGGPSRTTQVVTVNSNVVADNTQNVDFVYLVVGNNTVTLPSAVDNNNTYTIKRVGNSQVIVQAAPDEDIDNDPTIFLNTQYESVTLVSTTEGWSII